MDQLPSLLQTKILTYLSGEDVSRFSRLCSTFRKIIRENRIYLKKPLIAVEMYSKNGDPNKDAILLVYARYKKYDKNHYRLYPREDEFLTDVYYEPWDYCPTFFNEFYNKNDPNQSLRSFFDFMLENADIDELSVNSLLNATWLQTLSESINASSCRIYSVLISPFYAGVPEVLSLLKSISEQKQKDQVKPHLRIGSFHLNEEQWNRDPNQIPDIHKLNDVSSMFYSARFEVISLQTSELILTIASQWETKPISKFFFDIQSTTTRNAEYFENVFVDVSPQFHGEVTISNKEYFIRLSPTDEPSSFCLLGRESTLQFTKKNGLTSPDYPIFRHSVSEVVTVDISIDTLSEQ